MICKLSSVAATKTNDRSPPYELAAVMARSRMDEARWANRQTFVFLVSLALGRKGRRADPEQVHPMTTQFQKQIRGDFPVQIPISLFAPLKTAVSVDA